MGTLCSGSSAGLGRGRLARASLARVGAFLALVGVGAGAAPGGARADPRGVRVSFTSFQGPAGEVTIAWNTEAACNSVVRIGTDPADLSQEVTGTVSATPLPELGYGHEVILGGLDASSTYFYEAGDETCGFSLVRSFRTGSDDPCQPFTFIAEGDPRSNDDFGPAEYMRPILDEALLHHPLFVLMNGDLVEEGKEALQWSHFVDALDGLGTAFMPAIGNHDDDVVQGDEALYNQVFALPRNDDPASGTEDYYAFESGDAIIVTISTSTFHDGEDFSVQAAWLDRVLTEHDRTWKVVQFHHPCLTTDAGVGTHPANELGQNDDFMPILDAHHVDVVLNSHNHVYERFRPMAANSDDWAVGTEKSSYAEAPMYVITGGAGAPTMFVFDEVTRVAEGSEVRSGEYHYLAFRVGGDRLEMNVLATFAGWEMAMKEPGRVIDRVVLVKAPSELGPEAASCAPTESFDQDEDGFFSDVDCDDHDPSIRPYAEELCDGVDNNCDGQVDEGLEGCQPPLPPVGCGCAETSKGRGLGAGAAILGLLLLLGLLGFRRRGAARRPDGPHPRR